MPEPVIPDAEAAAKFGGDWYLVDMVMEGTQMDPAAIGYSLHVNLKDDGTIDAEMNGMPVPGLWFAEGETVSFSMGTDTESGGMEGELLVLRGGDSSLSFSRNAPDGKPAAPVQEPGSTETDGLLMDVKYRMVTLTAVASGAVKSADDYQEYSITFHADGTADFVMSGAPVPGLPWTVNEDGVAVDYSGNALQCTIEDHALEMNFFGSMLLKMVPEE